MDWAVHSRIVSVASFAALCGCAAGCSQQDNSQQDNTAQEPMIGGETTDFGGGVPGCAQFGHRELSPSDLGPDGRTVQEHLDELQGSFTLPLDWVRPALSGGEEQSGSDWIDVEVETTAMFYSECSLAAWMTGTTDVPPPEITWNVISTITVASHDGSLRGRFGPVDYHDGWAEYHAPGAEQGSGRGYFELRGDAVAEQFDAMPQGVQSITATLAIVDGQLKGVLNGITWYALINDDGCPRGTLTLDEQAEHPLLDGGTPGELAAELRQSIDALAPASAQWLLLRRDDEGRLQQDGDGGSELVQLSLESSDFQLCDASAYFFIPSLDLALTGAEQSFSFPLSASASVAVDLEGGLSELVAGGGIGVPTQIDGKEYLLQHYDVSVAVTDDRPVTSGRVELWEVDPPLSTSGLLPDNRVLTW